MKRFLIIIFLSLAATVSHAQTVGLVLSGGGAKGLYHVGIIRALEENQIPIDYVGGASMGAIVSAMYASGWSPERMWNFFLTDSVSTWLSGKIPDQYKYYYRKFDPTPEMISIKINPDTLTGRTLQLPTNLISPYMIDLAMNNILYPPSAAAGGNFDSLMVPFRCVASDMHNRELVLFRDGSLPFAVRASMSIPLVFKPLVFKDTTLLYDGGVLNNYPFQAMLQDFDPDIMIGGVCAGNSKNPSQDDIMGQVMMLITENTDYALPDSTDITVRGRLKDIGMLDYGKAAIVMQRGYDDAMVQMDTIKSRIARRVSREEIAQKRQKFLDKQPLFIFDSVKINGLTRPQLAYVRRQLGLHLHTHFTFDYFYEKYLHMISAEVFSADFPQISYNRASGYYNITLNMRTQPSMRFSLGGNISSSSLNQGFVAFNYQHVTNNVGTYGIKGYFGSFYNSAQVGARHDMFTNFPFYIDWSYTYEAFNWDTGNAWAYYANRDWRFKDQRSNFVSTSIAVPVLGNSAFRARLSGGVADYTYYESLHTSADTPSKSKYKHGSLSVELETNSMNHALYEDLGVKQLFMAQYTYGAEDYDPGSLNLNPALHNAPRGWFEVRYMREQYFKSSGWFTVGYLVDAVLSTHPSFDNDLISSFTAPRFTPTPHTQTLFMSEFASSSYFGFGVMPVFHFLKNRLFYLKTYAYAFIPQEIIHDDGRWQKPTFERFDQFTNFIFGGTIVYQTPIGPASFTVAKYTTGRQNWNFVFNFGYTLFGKTRF